MTKISDFVGKNVLELGSGTGLVGFSLALCGAKVTLTDATELLPLLNTNFELNKKNLDNNVIGIKEVDWSNSGITLNSTIAHHVATTQTFIKEEQEAGRSYDYIVLADAIFHERAVVPLVTTLQEIASKLSSPTGAIHKEIISNHLY